MFKSEVIHSRKIGALIVAIFFGVLFISTVSAQWSSDLARELEKTDQLIERATDAARHAGSTMAHSHMGHAIRLQVEAKDSFKRGMFNKSYKLTMAARDQINRSVAILRSSERNDATVRRAVERTNEILARADENITESGSLRASSLYETSRKTQAEAIEFFRGNRLKISLKATLKARDIARRAMAAANSDIDIESRARRELDKTVDMISRAREQSIRLGTNGNVSQLLANAEDIQLRARVSLESGKFRISLKQAMNARDVTKRALGIMEQSSQPDRIESLLKQNQRLIDRLRDALSENPDLRISSTLENAIAHHENATIAFRANDLQKSMVEAKVARDLILKAESMTGR